MEQGFFGPTEDKVVVQWSPSKCLVYLRTRCLFKACDVLDAEQSNGCRSHFTRNPVHSYYDKALGGQGDQPRITNMKRVWHGHTAINWGVVSASKSPMLKPTEAWGMIMATLWEFCTYQAPQLKGIPLAQGPSVALATCSRTPSVL